MGARATQVTILGSYSGRNAGDAAILASTMYALSSELGEDTVFEVPTTHPDFVRDHYGQMFNVRALSVMPWTGSLRLLGIPTLRSIRRTDVTLITDGIIFDVKLFNPLFNFLILLVFLVPWARLCGKRVACYNVGIGPLTTRWGRRFARWVGNLCDPILVRDDDSLRLFREIGVRKPIHVLADSVFLNWAAPPERTEHLLAENGLQQAAEASTLMGINVTTYLDQWLGRGEKVSDREGFLPMLARCLVRLKRERGIEPVIFTTQVMDKKYGEKLQGLVAERHVIEAGAPWTPALIDNVRYDNHEILGAASCCRLFVGMRLHSLIIAARAGTPVVGLAYAPKVRSFLAQLGTPDRIFELSSVDADQIFAGLADAWEKTEDLRRVQQAVVEELEAKARKSPQVLRAALANPGPLN